MGDHLRSVPAGNDLVFDLAAVHRLLLTTLRWLCDDMLSDTVIMRFERALECEIEAEDPA
jgi:hypothetical protein